MHAATPDPIVIVGAGLAGYGVARELRRHDTTSPLAIVSADGSAAYSKPMLSSAFGQRKEPAALSQYSAERMAAQLGAIVRAHTRVSAIDTQRRRVHVGDEQLTYSRLVLALGADQIRPRLPGDATATIMTVNDLEDYAAFRAAVAGRRHVTLIGGGLIGCEFANDLVAGGYDVSVVDVAAWPLSRLLPAEAGQYLRGRLEAAGVHWHLGTAVTSVDRAGRGLVVRLADGNEVATDVVLSSIGLQPRTALALGAGIAVGRGVTVDRDLATSAEDVYALGDCAEIAGLLLPYVMPITHAAKALAATLAGRRTAVSMPAMAVLVKTPACPTIVAAPPSATPGRWDVAAAAGGVRALFLDDDGRLRGFALCGEATAERAALLRELPAVLA